MYEYDSNTMPALPPDYVLPDSPTDIQLLEQIIHNQEKQIEFYYFELNKEKETSETLKTQNDTLHSDNELIVEKLGELVNQGSTGDSAISDSNTQILQKLTTMNSHLSEIHTGSNTVITYGVFYIPFAIILFLLWRFFSTFLRSAY
jgi:hypothetical protein